MEKQGITWFPPVWRQALNFVNTGYVVNNEEFIRACQFHFGDITFEEAYEATRKHVCISVTRRGGGTGGPSKLLLNHISTPHVLVRSAVAASCALPGIMKPNALLMKTSDGEIMTFQVDGEGVQFLDGSVEADVPFRRMGTLFSVSNFIVSQVNIHVIPFIGHKVPGALTSDSQLLKNVLASLDLDLRHRSVILSKMGIMPKLYGHDISSVFKQVYHGNVTIVPRMKVEESLGVKAFMQPTKEDMRSYIRGGQKATWPHLRRVKHLLLLEARLWKILEKLVTYSSAVSTHRKFSPTEEVNATQRQLSKLSARVSVTDLVMYAEEPSMTVNEALPRIESFEGVSGIFRENIAERRMRHGTRQYRKNSRAYNTTTRKKNRQPHADGDPTDDCNFDRMAERIEELEHENRILRQRVSEKVDEENAAPILSRKRSLSACLEPI